MKKLYLIPQKLQKPSTPLRKKRGELTIYASAPTPEEAVNALALDLRKIWECIESEFIWVGYEK